MFDTHSQHHFVKDLPSSFPNEATRRVSNKEGWKRLKTYDSSISGCLPCCKGLILFLLGEDVLKAGLGDSLVCLYLCQYLVVSHSGGTYVTGEDAAEAVTAVLVFAGAFLTIDPAAAGALDSCLVVVGHLC